MSSATAPGNPSATMADAVPGAAALAMRDVCATLGGLLILDDVSIDVPAGQITGLIGPNGAGKTTVFNVLSGFIRPDSGQVLVSGRPQRRMRPHDLSALGIARTLQGVGLFASLSVLDNVALGARMRRGFFADALALPWSDKELRAIENRAQQALEELGVGDVAARFPGELPYPVQKRVALARALCCEPRVLLLDEPAGGISADDIEDLASLMRSWVPKMSVLLVEHHMELVMEVCDTIWVLDAGRVIAHGTADEIRSNRSVIEAYLGEEISEGGAFGEDVSGEDG